MALASIHSFSAISNSTSPQYLIGSTLLSSSRRFLEKKKKSFSRKRNFQRVITDKVFPRFDLETCTRTTPMSSTRNIYYYKFFFDDQSSNGQNSLHRGKKLSSRFEREKSRLARIEKASGSILDDSFLGRRLPLSRRHRGKRPKGISHNSEIPFPQPSISLDEGKFTSNKFLGFMHPRDTFSLRKKKREREVEPSKQELRDRNSPSFPFLRFNERKVLKMAAKFIPFYYRYISSNHAYKIQTNM